MLNSKKAQISDTMSWIVATVIIVLILSIPIFLINFKIIEQNIYFPTNSDLIATKSISGYLFKNHVALFQEARAGEKFEEKRVKDIEFFADSLSRDKNLEKWRGYIMLKDSSGSKTSYEWNFYISLYSYHYMHSFFILKEGEGELNVEFTDFSVKEGYLINYLVGGEK